MTARFLKSIFCAAAACMALAAPVRADDASDAQATAWSGPWIGALGSAGRLHGDGALGGVSGGYDVQFDRIVAGLDADFSAGDLDARRAGGRYGIEALGAIRARVGYAFDRFVAFGAGGFAFASTEFARGGDRDQKWSLGWTLGAGVDVAITGSVGLRAEYVHVELDRRAFDAGGRVRRGASGGLARLGVHYRF